MGLDRPGRWAKGLTLMELLVAVSIMVILILAFSTVLTESQKVVRVSQAKMYANTAAKAIEQVLRDDLRKLTQNGFLSIKDGDKLVFTTAGITESVVGDAKGTGGVMTYGKCYNDAEGSSGGVLFRQGWVLDKDTTHTGDDQWEKDFSEIQAMDQTQMGEECTAILNATPKDIATEGLVVPPSNATEAEKMWMVLAANCASLKFEWFDRTDDTWKGTDNIWTQHDQSNWPKAIKITFGISNPELPADFQSSTYEIICPVGAGT
jgi:prepilin-type N-terminal cleavage/methylation domain-containing protein